MADAALEQGHFAPRANIWSDLTRSEIMQARDAGALVVIPTGATEQHGDHLGTGTDTFLATAVAELAAAQVNNPRVLVTPSVPIGFSPHHLSWPGTLSLRLETYLHVLRDIAMSVIESGFPRAVFVNGHGGNSAPLRALCGEMVTDGHAVGMVDYFVPAKPNWVPMLSGGLANVGHACEYETALTMALAPDSVANKVAWAAADLPPRLVQPWMKDGASDPITAFGAAWPPIFQADDCGYWGDPACATAVAGKAMLEKTVDALAEFFIAFATADLRMGTSSDPSTPRMAPRL
jgi:creatinine amidohydrolase